MEIIENGTVENKGLFLMQNMTGIFPKIQPLFFWSGLTHTYSFIMIGLLHLN